MSGDLWVYSFDAVDGAVVHATSTPTMPNELYVGDRRLTEVSTAFCEQAPLQPSERFVAVSPDGEEVESWLVRPHDFAEGKRYPMLLNIHGGPFSQYGNKFFDEFQAYARAGYAVVYSNPRGSSGYSEEWGRAIRGPSAAATAGARSTTRTSWRSWTPPSSSSTSSTPTAWA